MKIHATNLLIAAAICALLTYGIISIEANAMKAATGIGSFISLASTLALAIGVSFDNARIGANMRVVAVLFFAASLVMNGLFAFAGFSQTIYIITCGILFLVYVLIANALFTAQH
jgi:hypothetical protein